MAVHTISESTTTNTPAADGCPGSRLLANAGEMTLRVHAPEHEPREVRIRSPKCTVGSAAGCTLRLRARGVGGLHCWILRGAQGSIVRRLHGSTMLNGAQFDEAPVKIGDRLRIGPVELEIIECNQPPAAPQPVFQSPHEPSEETAELQLKLDEALLQIKRLQAESRQAFQSSIVAAERADQLRDALALANDQLEEMYKELAASEQTIERVTTELEDCRRQLAESDSAGKQDGVVTEKVRQQATAASKECERLTAELASTKVAASKEREAWTVEREELQRLIAQQAAELESARSSTVAQTCALTVPLDKHSADDDAVRKELQAKLAGLEQQLASKQREIDSLQQQLDDQSAEGCAMTIALGERSKEDDVARTKLQAKLTDLEQQLAAKQCEVDSLQQRLDGEAAQGCAMTVAFNERSKDIDAARKELQSKLSDFEQQLAEKQGEIDALEERLQGHAAVQHKLERLAAEYDIKCRELQDVRGQLAAAGEANSAAQQELDQQTEALLVREQDLVQRETAFAEAQKRSAQEQDQLKIEHQQLVAIQERTHDLEQQQSQLNDRAAELQALSAQAASKQTELEALRRQLDDERTSLESQRRQFDQQRQELELQQQQNQARAQELESLQQVLQAQQLSLNEQLAAAVASRQVPADQGGSQAHAAAVSTPPAANTAAADEPAGVDSVLSRLVKAGLWRGDEAGAGEPEAGIPATRIHAPEPVAEQTPADADDVAPHPSTDAIAPLSPAPGGSGSDEESIESYMERLMQRVRGEDGPPTAGGAAPISHAPTSPAPIAPEPAAAVVTGEEQQPAAEPGEFAPRRPAPEVVANLSAMRDLANTAARSAIDRHVRKHTGQQATGRLIGACLTVALAAGLGYWAFETNSMQAAAGAIIGGGLGAHWLLSAARRLFKLRRLNAPQNAATAPDDQEPKAAP